MSNHCFSESEPIMVSIRCLTYNQAPFIRQCLDGIVMQKTTFRFQAVVHDDASTDGTTEIVKEYAEKYPGIIIPMFEVENRWSKHDGTLLTIMYPLLVGKYLAHCEGDDYWIDQYKLQKQVDFLEANPTYILTYSDYCVVDGESRKILSNRPKTFSGPCAKPLIAYGNFICTPTTLYLRKFDDKWPEFLINLPIRPKMSDYVHWLYLSSFGNFKHINECTASYRKLSRSASHFDDFLMVKEFHENARQVRILFNKWYSIHVSEQSINRSFYEICIRAAMPFTKRVFLEELKEAFKNSPIVLLSPKVWVYIILKLVLGKTM